MRTVTIDELPDLKGTTLGPSCEYDGCERRPFGTTIAHGYLTVSLIPHLMTELIEVDCGQTLNYGADTIRLPAVPVGSRIRSSVTAASIDTIANGYQVGYHASVACEQALKTSVRWLTSPTGSLGEVGEPST